MADVCGAEVSTTFLLYIRNCRRWHMLLIHFDVMNEALLSVGLSSLGKLDGSWPS